MSAYRNPSLGIDQVDKVKINDLTVGSLTSKEIYLTQVLNSITIDFASFGINVGVSGRGCLISVNDTADPSKYGLAMGYYHYTDVFMAQPYGLTSCTILNAVGITLTAGNISSNKYGLKIDYPGAHNLVARVLLF